jgi:hypothetical protein
VKNIVIRRRRDYIPGVIARSPNHKGDIHAPNPQEVRNLPTDCEIEILDIEAHLDARKSEPMTDEPDKVGRQFVAPVLLVALLPPLALAFLAGCKSESPITRPKASYLQFDDDSVTFLACFISRFMKYFFDFSISYRRWSLSMARVSGLKTTKSVLKAG